MLRMGGLPSREKRAAGTGEIHMIDRMRGALLGSTGLVLILVAGPALADCQPAVPANGQTVTCTGLDTVGVDGSAATQVTVNVLVGATVNPAAATTSIAVGALSLVNNAGAIVNGNVLSGSDTVGIDLTPGSGSAATNAGSIAVTMDAGDMAAVGIRTGNGNTVVNTGTIQATATNGFSSAAFAIGGGAAGGSANVVTNTGALLATGSDVNQVSGILLNDSNTITNSGAVIATGTNVGAAYAVSLGDGNTVTNSGTLAGLGSGSDEGRGIIGNDNNVITNSGTIIGRSGDCCGIGIDVFNGNTIVNTGTIAGVVTGSGQAFGIVAAQDNVIVNNGRITASALDGQASGVGIVFTSTVTNNGTITATATEGQAFGIQVQLGGGGNTIVNNGIITATVTGSAVSTTAIGIQAFASDTITNSGTIEAIATGGGDSIAVALFGLNVLTNTASGRIIANSPGGIAVEFDDASNTLINQGLIQAIGVGGIALSACGCVSDTVVVNSGTIDGQVSLDGGSNTLTNSGLITVSTAGTGIAHLVAGTFTQTASGTLALRVDATPTSDTLAIVGTANLGGTLRATVQPGLYGATQTYVKVIDGTGGGTVVGTFASVASSSPFFAPSAAYFADHVDLTLTRIAFGAVPGATDNQRAVGNALESQYSVGLTGNAATIYANLLAATSLAALDALSGEIGTGAQNPSFAMGDAFSGALFGQLQRWRAGGSASSGQSAAYRVQFAAARPAYEMAQAVPGASTWPPRSVGPRWAAWASGFGLGGSRDGDGSVGSGRLGYTMGGGAFGADAEIAPNLVIGGAVAAAASYFSLDSRASSGDARTIFFGLYGSWTSGPLYVDAALSYGHGQFTTKRTITSGTTTELANGAFDGNQYGGRIEAGWRFMVQRYELTPFAGLAVQALQQDGYRESTSDATTFAPGILGLSYQGETTTSVRSFLGGQAATTYRLGERMTVSPRLRLAWAHEFSADRQVNASFLSIPGAAFTVSGARPPRDSAIVGAGVDLALGRNVALFAQFDGDLSADGNAYAGTGGLRISW
jgi:uncharacterized protein with beta-barrel porin domain